MEETPAASVYARPVIALLIALMSGIAAGLDLPGRGAWAWSLAAAGMAAVVWGVFRKKTAVAAPLALFLALGYLGIQPWARPKFALDHVSRFAEAKLRGITGTIDSLPVVYPNRLRFILKVESLGLDPVRPARGRIVVSVWGNGPALTRGERIAFDGTVRPFRNFNNPGAFDYERYMHFRRIWGTANARAEELRPLGREAGSGDRLDIEAVRRRIAGLIRQTGDGQEQAVLQALIIGERGRIGDTVKDAFNRAGASHLLAISGLHVGIVAAAAFAIFKWLLQWIRPLLWRAWTRKAAALLALFPVIVYGLLAGMSPSTQRAVIMVVVFLLSFLLETDQDLINTLAVAALAILAIHPPALFSTSFQLSFAAVFFIVYGMAAFGGGRLAAGGFKRFWAFILVSFLAVLGTLPLVMRCFNQVSLVGPVSNIILIPLVGFVAVPLGLTATFILPVSPAAALACFKLAAAILSLSLAVVRFFADLPFAAIQTVTPNHLEIVCYYGLAGLMLRRLHRRQQLPAGRGGGREVRSDKALPAAGTPGRQPAAANPLRRLADGRFLTAGLAGLLLLAAGLDIGYWYYQRFRNPDLRVTVIDVGQGSAALLELPRGYNVLIDGGGFSDNSSFDVGARVVAPLLWRKKIRTVHALILSHPNSDHLNGLGYIAAHFNVRTAWTNGQGAATQGYRQFLEIIGRQKIRMPPFAELPRSSEINGVRFDLRSPPPGFIARGGQEKWRNLNNNSLVVQVRFGDRAILFPGDIMAPAEAELAATAGAALASAVLLAPHHGSAKSSSTPFLDAVSPEVVIFSNGWKNRFKFPHAAVLEKYRRRGCRIFRTDTDGAVLIRTDGKALHVRSYLAKAPERSEQIPNPNFQNPNHIQVSNRKK